MKKTIIIFLSILFIGILYYFNNTISYTKAPRVISKSKEFTVLPTEVANPETDKTYSYKITTRYLKQGHWFYTTETPIDTSKSGIYGKSCNCGN